MTQWIEKTAGILWSAPMVFALFAVFLYITCKAHFPQRRLASAFRELFRGHGAYRAVSVNLSAVLGVGNIAGVAMAIASGGPGAVLWCFVSGLTGVGVQFAECLICAKYTPLSGIGGPMHVLRRFGMKYSAVIYAAAVCICGLLIGAAIPAGTIAGNFAVSPVPAGRFLISLFLVVPATLVITGGGRRAADFCAYAIPPTLFVYLVVCAGILWITRECLPDALQRIVSEAFSLRPVLSGVGGYGFSCAVRWGAARGLFSSEAGMGTAGITAAEAIETSPTQRALGCACSAVIDTLILATLTGVCFVSAELHNGGDFSDANRLISGAFSLFPYVGKYFIAICVTFLGFSTIIGWYWVAQRAYAFLFPHARQSFLVVLWLAAVFFGAAAQNALLWDACDIMTVFLLIPNLRCILRVLPHCRTELASLDQKTLRVHNLLTFRSY